MEVSGTNKMRTDMKKTFKFFAAALAIVAAASCAKETVNEPVDNSAELVNLTFAAEIDNDSDQTKTTLANDGLSVHWTANDAIWVFPYNSTGDPYYGSKVSIVNESISGNYALFTGNVSQSNNYAAIHPASYVTTGGEANRWRFVEYTLRNQTAVKGNFPTTDKGPAHVAMAIGNPGEVDFQFKNSLSYLKFTVDSDITTIVVSADQVSSASGDGTNRALTTGVNLGGTMWYRPGTGKFDLTSWDYPITFTNNGSNLDKNVTYYIALPPVEMKGLIITGKNSANEVIFEYKKNSFDAQSNEIYNVGCLSPNIKKTYSVVKQLSNATELENGKLYVISYLKDTKLFWTEQDMYVKLSSTATNNEYEINNVFIFHKQDASAAISGYKTTVVGRWESLATNKYMSNNPAMNATSSNATDIAIGQWDGNSKDFDMYIQNSSGASNTLYYNGTRVAAGSISTAESSGRGQQARKWYIYEVKED